MPILLPDIAHFERLAPGTPTRESGRGGAASVEEMRRKLAARAGGERAFDHELVLHFATNRLSTAFLVPLLALVVAAIGSIWLEGAPLLLWLTGVLAANGAILWLCRRFVRTAPEARAPRRAQMRLSLLETVHGLIWAAIVVVPTASADHPAATVFLVAVSLMVVAVGAMLSSSLSSAVWGGTLPITLVVTFALGVNGEALSLAMALMTVSAQAYFLLLAQRLYSTTLDNLRMRAEQDRLIEELEDAKRASDEARGRAEAANLAKSRFLATMSHELRTPLNAILGFSEVMKAEILGPMANATYKEYAADIHSSGQHLLNLINEVLDLSRIEAGRLDLKEESVNLVYSIEDCTRLLALRIKAKGIALKEHFEADMPPLWADERAVRQITLNLLSNALKFTPTGGTITVKAGWTAGGGQYLMMRDTGPGLPAEEIPHVLATFGQGSNAIKAGEPGVGLGLPIVRGLVDLHGGTFHFKSDLRVGTEVVVTFPPERVMQPLSARATDAREAA